MKRRATAIALAAVLACGLGGCLPQGCSNEQQGASESVPASKAEVSKPSFETKTNVVIAADQETPTLVDALNEGLCSWNMGGTDASTVEGDDYGFSPVVYVNGGTYDPSKSLAGDKVSVDNGTLFSTGIQINKVGVNGVVAKDSALELEHVKIEVNTPQADGSTTCDFSGKGAALAAYGQSDVKVRDSILTASGVANLAAFSDNGAKVLLDGVELSSAGGTLYQDYVNSPSQKLMVAPPWILGIMGTSRGTNLMGTNSTMSVVDSAASAANWAVLSTDAGSNMRLNVVNSTMDLTGSTVPFQAGDVFNVENPYTKRSGYGTYVIGDATENFLGTSMNVGTYATIFTGGSAYYGNLKAGQSYDLKAADGSTHQTYVADKDVQTTIESDTFGFMSHKGTNTVDIDGASVHSAYTGFLMKSGNDTDVTVRNGASITADNGILVQAMDNDDSTTAYDNEADAFATVHEENAGFPTEAVSETAQDSGGMPGGEAPAEMPGEGEQATEDAGEGVPISGRPGGHGGAPIDSSSGQGLAADGRDPSEISGDAANPGEPPSGDMPSGGAPSGAPGGMGGESGANTSTYHIENTNLEGSIYNGIGWKANDLSDGNVRAMTLDVTLSGTATLRGAIASTSCIHTSFEGQKYLKENGLTAFDDEAKAAEFASKYQLTSFSKAEYFNIGQVANLVKANGLNNINVSLTNNATWTVSGTSVVASLKVDDDAKVVVEDGVTLKVGDAEYAAGTYTAKDFS